MNKLNILVQQSVPDIITFNKHRLDTKWIEFVISGQKEDLKGLVRRYLTEDL